MNTYGQNQESVSDPKRRTIMVAGFGCVTLGIISRLWYLQILKGEDFSLAAIKNRVREVTVPAPRGVIYDKNGKILISNKLFFDLSIVPQYVPDMEKTLLIISKLFNVSVEQMKKKINDSRYNPKFIPIRIKRNLSLHEVALIESNRFFLPGVDVDSQPRRDYQGDESAHLFGYLGEVTLKELDILNSQSTSYEYRVGSVIGKTGIEKKFEFNLRGQEGKDALLVDAFGRLQAGVDDNLLSEMNQRAVPGYNTFLTIDHDLQKQATEAFKNKNGAVCAIDPRTGAILAYLSNPNYKLASYQDGLTANDWQNLRSNPFKPLLDKVTGGGYPPGSTFKVITALAALEEGVITVDKRFRCPGFFVLGTGNWKCWEHKGHGSLNVVEAIERSCDVFFYNVGNLLGIDRIAKWAKLFGLGEKTGLDLNMEISGIVPSTEWKLRTKGIPWQSGDTINASTGQGFNLYSPIQILNLFASISNGGFVYKPYLLHKILDEKGNVVQEGKPTLVREVKVSKENLDIVRQGLNQVVMSPFGTAKKARVNGFTVSGKTGTAQTSALKFTKGIATSDVEFSALDHAWFAGFSPSENPEIAVVVFSEYEGGGGGANAAPIAQKILETYWRKKHPEKFPDQVLKINKNKTIISVQADH